MGINFGSMGNSNTSGDIQEVSTQNGVVLDLSKGSLLDLNKIEPGLQKILVGAGWDANNTVPAFDLDLTAFMLNDNMKITSALDIIYFNNKSSAGVSLSGDNRTGSGEGDDESITIDLSQIPSNVKAIDFVVNIYDAMNRHQTFGMVSNSYIRILNSDKNNEEMCRFRLKGEYASSTAVILGRLERNGSDWNFRAVGEGKVVADLNGIAALYM